MKNFWLCLVVLSIGATGCDALKTCVVNCSPVPSVKISERGEVHPPYVVLTNQKGVDERPQDHLTIQKTELKGDILYITISTGGGCRVHQYSLLSNGAIAESLPPQMWLYLGHNANQDMCKALITETIPFDLKPLKTNMPKEGILLHIVAPKPSQGNHSVLYR